MIQTLFYGKFPELEAAWIAELASNRAADPLAPAHVLVPNHLLRLHLRREAASRGLPWLNIHFRTLHEFAVFLCQRAPGDETVSLPDVAIEPLLEQAIRTVAPRLTVLQPVAQKPGFRRAFWRTLEELRQGGIDAATLKQTSPRLATTKVREKFADMALIAAQFESQLNRLNLLDRAGMMARAIPLAADFREAVITYGFDALTTLERRVLQALPEAAHTAAFLPYQAGEPFEWTRPLFEWMSTQSRTIVALDYEAERRDRVSMYFVSAPTRDSEVRAVVSDLLEQAAQSETRDKQSVAILLRADHDYTPLARAQLALANVRGYVHQCRSLDDLPAGRALRHWLRLLDQNFAAADIINFLSAAPLRDQLTADDKKIAVTPALWIHLVRTAGIQRGYPEWQRTLEILQDGYMLSAAAAEKQQSSAAAQVLRSQAAATAELRAFMAAVSVELSTWRAVKSWAAVESVMLNFIHCFFRDDHGLAAVAAELAELRALDRLSIPVLTATLRSVLSSALKRPLRRDGQFQRDQPAVCEISAALGVPFDHVCLTGLVEKEFPRGAPSDPLLSDDDRQTLRRFLPHAVLSTRRERATLDRFLFAVACDSARRQLTFSWPRADAQSGRERLPSAFVLEPAQALDPSVRDYATLDTFVRTHAQARRLSANNFSAKLFPPSETAFDLRTLHAVRNSKPAAAIATLLSERPGLKSALEIQRQRFSRDDFTCFDGLVGNPGKKAFSETGSLLQATNSATRLQTYASCPFQFFARHVLRLSSYEEPEPIAALTPLTRGLVLHHILEHFSRAALAAQTTPFRWPELTQLEAIAERAFHELRSLFAQGSAFSRRYEQRQLLAVLRAWYKFEQKRTDATPQHIEQPFAITLGHLTLSGRIDRIDQTADGALKIIDYKTGKPKLRSKLLSLDGGRLLQLPLYLLALEQSNHDVSSAEFVQLDESRVRTNEICADEFETLRPRLLSTLNILQEEIAAGHCFPRPSAEICQYCDVRTACGSGRLTTKWSGESRQTAALRSLEHVQDGDE